MKWIERFLTNRYMKSLARYLLVALAATIVQVPVLEPIGRLIQENLGQFTEALAAVLVILVGMWSASKNMKNAKVESTTRWEVK